MQCSLPRGLLQRLKAHAPKDEAADESGDFSGGAMVAVLTIGTIKALPAAEKQALGEAIDEMGRRSAKAQGLSRPITSVTQMHGCDHRLYISVGRDEVRLPLRHSHGLAVP
jgi:hypothetical protein